MDRPHQWSFLMNFLSEGLVLEDDLMEEDLNVGESSSQIQVSKLQAYKTRPKEFEALEFSAGNGKMSFYIVMVSSRGDLWFEHLYAQLFPWVYPNRDEFELLPFEGNANSLTWNKVSYYIPCLKPLAFPYAETVFAIAIFSRSDSLAPLVIEFIEISSKKLGLGDGS
ncbi:hypothetical protein CQW23_16272 [Capsicum baccatum]|uniref:Uncharacterized protein n=1 Tax=Capsicum baccatum TaxID=33114 RepID=A0A2G2WAJ5_CAPBA|nr:hypothetical protein CQW23_16272 [Capsicum baccatum]